MEKYQIGFSKWSDVMEEFSNGYIGHSRGDTIKMPEPEGLIVARYDNQDYEADAQVLWRNEDGTYGFVEGSHCSCYGLEDQWKVEELTKEMIEKFIEANKTVKWSFWNKYADDITEAINAE